MAFPSNERERYLLAMLRGEMSPDYASMPPYALQNEFDKQAVLAQAGDRFSGAAPQAPMQGTESAYADGTFMPPASLASPEEQAAQARRDAIRQRSRSLKGQENKIASQRAFADTLRGQPVPQGREVGPLNVYMAPNWGESAAYMGSQALGGYLSGRADRADVDLDEQRTNIKTAEAEAEQARYDADMGIKKATLKLQGEELKATIANNLAKLNETRLARIDAAKGTWDGVSVHLPNGDPGTVVYNEKLGEYRMGNADGPVIPYSEAMKMIKYTAGADTGSIPASIQRDQMDRRAVANNIAMSIQTISEMAKNGQETSGLEGMIVDLVPKTFKGVAERAFFDEDEQKQRAKNTLIDNLIKEAVTTGVVSDQDSNMLQGLYISGGGLSPNQQLMRLYAAQEILASYGIDLMDLAANNAGTLGGEDALSAAMSRY